MSRHRAQFSKGRAAPIAHQLVHSRMAFSDQDRQIADLMEFFRDNRMPMDVLQKYGDVLAIPMFMLGQPLDLSQKHPHRPAPEVRETVAEKMRALEKRVEQQERAIEELKIQFNSGSLQERLDDVVKYMENAFGELEHVVQVSYNILQGGMWRVVAVHTLDDRGEALRTICKKSIEVQNAFGDVEITTLVLHEDEVFDEHLTDTKLIFRRR